MRLGSERARRRASLCVAVSLLIACGDDDGSGDDVSTGEGTSGSSSTSEGSTEGSTSSMSATAGNTTSDTTTSDSDATQTTGSGDTEDATTTDTGGELGPTMLPTPTGACPELANGDVVFNPAGTDPRTVRLWMSDAATTMNGPLVFYWHGTGSQPDEALYGLGSNFVDQVVAQGGIIVAPHSDPASGTYPWFLTAGTDEFDLLVADEVVACAMQQVGIDERRIHSAGMSAGGLHTSLFSYLRSGYLASVAIYSGGFYSNGPSDQDPSNLFSSMIFHGGVGDVVGISFQDSSENYLARMEQDGRFGFICDHGNGHTVPQEQASVWQFFQDHPWGTVPSPYAGGLPGGFPAYCDGA